MPDPLHEIGKFFENVAQGTQDGLEELKKNFDKISSSTLNFFQKAFEMGGALGKDFLASLNPAESMKWMGTYFLKSEVSNRKIAGTNQQRTDSWSFASSINYDNTNNKSKHNAFFGLKDTGAHLSFTLKRGRVHWTINGKIPKSGSLFGSTKAISYNKKRKGQEINLPLFDMIASSSDRIIAKVKDKDRYFMAIPTELYYHKTKAGKFITLPQSLFKFDPEIHREGRNTKDIIDSMNIKDDDFAHPATIRFQFLVLPRMLWKV